MKIEIPKNFYKKNFDNSNYENNYLLLKKMLEYEEIINSSDNIDFELINESFQGIIVPEKKVIICFSAKLKEGKIQGRNTFISQNFEPFFKYWRKWKQDYDSLILLNFLDYKLLFNNSLTLPNSIVLNLRILLTHNNVMLGNSINSIVGEKLIPFNNLVDYVDKIDGSSKLNKGNEPTYIDIDFNNKIITIFGKIDGANFSSTIQHCRNLAILKKDYKLEFYLLNDNIEKSKSKNLREINNVVEEIIESNVHQNEEKIFNRNQKIFKMRIIEKYKEFNIDVSECFCCNYPITENLIAAHIHRHSDIERVMNENIENLKFLSFSSKSEREKEKLKIIYKANELTTSGSNGFLLCRNHDVEFEKGMIYFDQKNKKFNINLSKKYYKEQIPEFISEPLDNYKKLLKIKDDISFNENIKQHHRRFNIVIEKS